MFKKKTISIFSLLALAILLSSFSLNASAKKKKNIGLQLYSLRADIAKEGIKPILKQVSKMGYVNLETANYERGKIYGLTPEEFKKECKKLGLKPISAHLGRNLSDNHAADMAWWDAAIADHAKAGVKYMVMPWAPIGENPSMEKVKEYANYFNEIGKKAKAAGIQFGYHNHQFEFQTKIEGKSIYDLLIQYTDPQYVSFEMDVYWVTKGGESPVEYLKKYPKRFMLLHIKDERVIGASGSIDFKSIFQAAYADGVKDWFVEMEDERTPIPDVKKSYDYLNNSDFVK